MSDESDVEDSKSQDKNDKKDDKQANCYLKFAIEIQDSGIGIKKEHLPHIFMDFMKIREH